jgi:hypothetical protein
LLKGYFASRPVQHLFNALNNVPEQPEEVEQAAAD